MCGFTVCEGKCGCHLWQLFDYPGVELRREAEESGLTILTGGEQEYTIWRPVGIKSCKLGQKTWT